MTANTDLQYSIGEMCLFILSRVSHEKCGRTLEKIIIKQSSLKILEQRSHYVNFQQTSDIMKKGFYFC